jgi:hypothetical protein
MDFVLWLKYLAWGAAGLAAVCGPSTGESSFRKLEELARRWARHRTMTWIAAGLLVLLVRGALLPVWPVPKPVIYDEFAYILQADTFAHGRLTNPTHKLWPFFESPYVLQYPTYASKYPPGQALAMAAGQVIFSDPSSTPAWFGVWLSCGAMMAALVWAMQGWLPPGWALLGGLLVLPVAIDSYWMNSYWGGAVAAFGGALVIGGYARVVRQKQVRYALAMGAGLAILANTRPYEGLVFSIPIAIALLFPRPRWRAVALIAAVLIPAFAATGYYNRTVTGSALQLPYMEYTRQYSQIPLFNFPPLQPPKVYKTPVMFDLHQNWEREQWEKARTWQLIPMRLKDWKDISSIVLGSVLMGVICLLFFPHLLRDRRIRLPLMCVIATLAGSLIEIFYYEHYAAPATAALFIVTVQALRHLRQWKPLGQPVGRFLSRALPLVIVGVVLVARGLVILRQEPPEKSQPRNARRDAVASGLRDQGGKHVILVRYTGIHSPHEEWVYNSADIDAQDVIWAHDLGSPENTHLLEYYKDRDIWLVQPDINPGWLDPYR